MFVCFIFYLFSQFFFSSTVSLSEMSQSFASHHHFLMTGDKERTQIQNVWLSFVFLVSLDFLWFIVTFSYDDSGVTNHHLSLDLLEDTRY